MAGGESLCLWKASSLPLGFLTRRLILVAFLLAAAVLGVAKTFSVEASVAARRPSSPPAPTASAKALGKKAFTCCSPRLRIRERRVFCFCCAEGMFLPLGSRAQRPSLLFFSSKRSPPQMAFARGLGQPVERRSEVLCSLSSSLSGRLHLPKSPGWKRSCGEEGVRRPPSPNSRLSLLSHWPSGAASVLPRDFCRLWGSLSSRPEGFFTKGGEDFQPPENSCASTAPASAVAEHASLRERIEALDEGYYGDGQEEADDAVYDALRRRLSQLEGEFPSLKSPQSPSLRVGSSLNSVKEGSAEHLQPVLSLESVYSLAEAGRQFRRIAKLVRAASWASKTKTKAKEEKNRSSPRRRRQGDRDSQDSATASALASDGSSFPEFFAEPKVDGLSLALTYVREDCKEEASLNDEVYRLKRGATRGDGRRGEDVTSKVLFLAKQGVLPSKFSLQRKGPSSPPVIEVRGEVFVPLDEFAWMNRRRREAKARLFSSPRHAVTGVLRRLEGQRCFEEEKVLRFCAYSLVATPSRPCAADATDEQKGLPPEDFVVKEGADSLGEAVQTGSSQASLLTQLEQWGFLTLREHGRQVSSEQEAQQVFLRQAEARRVHDELLAEMVAASFASAAVATPSVDKAVSEEERRRPPAESRLPLEKIACDGVVFKLASRAMQRRLGETSRAPRWAFALKFSKAVVESRVRAVRWVVGASGVCVPVAEFDPVLVGGVTLCKASLHSAQHLRRKDVRVGDRVRLRLKGEAVPQIEQVDFEARRALQQSPQPPPELPLRCPSCQSLLLAKTPSSHSGKRASREAETDTTDGAAGPAKEAAVLRCPSGWGCQAQRNSRLRRFFSREGVEVSGAGPKTLLALERNGYLRLPADLLRVRETDEQRVALGEGGIASWEGWGVAARDALFASVEETRKRGLPLERLLFALGIPGLGHSAAALIARRVQTLDGFLNFLEALSTQQDTSAAGGRAREEASEGDERQLPLDAPLLRELELFGADPVNREQLRELRELLYIQPAEG